jgi:arylsulfatase
MRGRGAGAIPATAAQGYSRQGGLTVTRPNVLWICSDQQRADTLGCYGGRQVATPHIDRLAASGALFEQCYCQSPVCTPSRASFLTGRYPRTTRCRQNGQDIPADEVLVTRLLADAGYTCGLAGKLHLSACHPSAAPAGERRIADGYAEFHWSHHPMPDWPTNAYVRWVREGGADYATPAFEGSRFVRRGMPEALHQTTWCAEQAIGFMRANSRFARPWLMSVNIFDPHHPFDPPEELLRAYADRLDDVPLPNYVPGELDGKPAVQERCHGGAYGTPGLFPASAMTAADHRLVRAAYWAMCALIDRQVGRILAALEASGQAENTIVIFMSDHGELLGDHGIYLKGPFFYDPAVRVPLIVSWPGRIAPARYTGLAELVDLAPTLLEAAGLPPHPGMQGRSLWQGLTAGALCEKRPDVYSEFYNAAAPPAFATMLRTASRKLVAHHGTGTGELYDLERDPTETVNLWHDAAYLGDKAALLSRLCDRMAGTVDPLPPRRAGW